MESLEKNTRDCLLAHLGGQTQKIGILGQDHNIRVILGERKGVINVELNSNKDQIAYNTSILLLSNGDLSGFQTVQVYQGLIATNFHNTELTQEQCMRIVDDVATKFSPIQLKR